jgi:hypothetical protein
VGGTTLFPTVKNAAIELRKKHPKESLEELKSRGFDAWVRESFALARKVAYRDGKLRGVGTETTGKSSRPITPRRPSPLPTVVPPSPGTGSRRSCGVVWARKHRSKRH